MSRNGEENRRISSLLPGSIAEEIGVVPGDILLSIDGTEVADIFDFRIRELAEVLTIETKSEDGSRSVFEIEKDEDEELGLVFSEPLLDQPKACSNRCLFCFIDQLPAGMRPSLYFKDDDPRLCFTDGNFITLTNIDDAEFDRLLSYRLSPLNVSVHTTDPELRQKMMNNRFAGKVTERLQKAVANGIDVNCQIVLCPGINDGEALDRTVCDLVKLGEHLLSIAVVPVGLTRYRDGNKLFPLLPYDRAGAGKVLDFVRMKQSEWIRLYGRRLLFAADEFYIRAERPIPTASHYEDFYQLENGVGLLAARRKEWRAAVAGLKRSRRFCRDCPRGMEGADRFLLISGVDAAGFVREELSRAVSVLNTVPEVLAVPNRFFGENVTVTGLLTGADILATVRGHRYADPGIRGVLLPDVTLRSGEDVFLDDMTVGELSAELGLPVIVYETTGRGLIEALISIREFSGYGNEGGQVL